MNEIYANTKKQPLNQHLFAVGVVAEEIMKTFSTDKKLQKSALIAGYWHDIGKLEVHFQCWLNKELKKKDPNMMLPENGVHIEKGDFSWDKYPTHNEVSTLIYELLADDSNFAKEEKSATKHAIYWHHAKPIRKSEIKKLNQVEDQLKDNDLKSLIGQSKSILSNVNNLSEDYFDKKFIKIKEVSSYDEKIDDICLPKYKTYKSFEELKKYQEQIKKNAKNNLVRTAVITADRLVSSLSSEELQNYINNKELEDFAKTQLIQERGLNQHIKTCLDGFNQKYPDSKRNKQQAKAAKDLTEEEINIGVLSGPAGCGKTKIALEWALNVSAKQILWICPRVAICQSLFRDLTNNEYLPNATVEIHTGEFKYNNKTQDLAEHFSGDVVLTTIDQIINGITTHKNISTLARFMNATVVFDEFHEYIPTAGLNILFAELIQCKDLQQGEDNTPNTLLVSATPNYYFVEKFLGLSTDDIISIDSFNEKKYQIELVVDYDETKADENNPLYQKTDKNTFVISNTAITAQKSFIHNQAENSLLTHSKFTPEDRAEIFKKVVDNFKENGLHKIDVLRSGPVVQAALNISCQNMISEASTAENILQRLGRLNRFAEFDVATLKIATNSNIKTGKQKGSLAKFLSSNFQLQSTKVWIEFLRNKLEDNQDIAITILYDWYKEFYQNDACIKMVKQDFISSLKKSVQVIDGAIFDPKRIKFKEKEIERRLKKHSLRGNSRFVQMAIYDVNVKEVSDKYLETSITLSVDEIINYGDDESALTFMGKKHHSIKEDLAKKCGVKKNTKYKSKIYLYLEKSRDPETPIFVSYTQSDLDKVTESVNRDYAIYYVKGLKQPIGVMTLSKLTQN